MDRLNLITAFVKVVDTGGFSSAARALGLSPPAVTRAVNDLEAHLGVRLLTRTTRSVRVTEAGLRYAEDCRAVLAQLNEADEAVAGLSGAPRGHLTITAPAGFGALCVTPVVTEYLAQYPEVTASCWFMDRIVDLIEEGVDVAVRIGHLPDSSMQAIRVGEMRLLACAAPAYLQRHGTPRTPADLKQHVIIAPEGVTSTSEWRMRTQGLPNVIKLQPRLMTTTSEAAITAALTGFGITNVLRYKVAACLENGSLVQVLADHEPPALPVHVLHREGRHASRKARAFIDLAVERIRARLDPGPAPGTLRRLDADVEPDRIAQGAETVL